MHQNSMYLCIAHGNRAIQVTHTHTQHLCKIKVGYQKLHHKWAIRIQKQQPNAN